MAGTTLNSSLCYSGGDRTVHWEGRVIVDKDKFTDYLQSVVIPRLEDRDSALQAELLALATTQMQIEYVEEFFYLNFSSTALETR